jgi:hypothetical protein
MENGNKIPVFSFVPPVAGMFVWQKYHLGRNEGYLSKKSGNMGEREAIAEWSVEFWKKLIENKVRSSVCLARSRADESARSCLHRAHTTSRGKAKVCTGQDNQIART